MPATMTAPAPAFDARWWDDPDDESTGWGDPTEDDEDGDGETDETPLAPTEPARGLTFLQWETLAEIADRFGNGKPLSFDGRTVWLPDVTERAWVRWWAWTTLRNLPVEPVVFGSGISVSLDVPELGA